MRRPKTLILNFLNRVCYGSTPCSVITLHAGSIRSPALLSDRVSNNGITSQTFNATRLDSYVDKILDFINEGDVDDDEEEAYYLYAQWEDGEQEGIASHPIKPKRANGSSAQLLNQAWRHIEAQMRINASMAESVCKHSSVQMHHATRMVEEVGDASLRAVQAEQALADRTHERQLEAKRDERQAEMIQAGLQGLLACLPMFAGKLSGILPMGANAMRSAPQYQMLKSLFENTQIEQWPMIMSWLEAYPGTVAEKAALKMAVESLMTDMINAEKEAAESNGKAKEDGPSIRH